MSFGREEEMRRKEKMNSQVLYKDIVNVCKTIYDPQIPQNIWDLGLVYSVDIDEEKNVDITMSLTTPSCPVGPEFLNTVKTRVKDVDGVNKCNVELVWDPPWNQEMMSDEAKTMLGMELNRPMLDGTRAGGDGSWE